MNKEAFKIRSQKEKNSGFQNISIEGDIGLSHISMIKEKIDSIDFAGNEISIELKNADTFDISTFQMIHSLRKSLTDQGKKVSVKCVLSENMKLIMNNAGIDEFLEKWENSNT